MKKIFLCALLITTQWMSAQNKTNAQGQKEGKWSGYYESNHLRYIGEFKDGKEVGVFTFYEDTPEQVIKATQDFSKEPGKSFATFYFEGKKMSEGWFAGKQKEGRWTYFHKGGEKINSEEFYKDGKLEGVRKVYYLSGAVSDEIPYKNGKMHGTVKMFGENGVVLKEENYVNGMRHGESIYRDGAGNVIKKGNFINDELQGKWSES